MDKNFFLVAVLSGLLIWFLYAIVVPLLPAPFQSIARVGLAIVTILLIAAVVFLLFTFIWAHIP